MFLTIRNPFGPIWTLLDRFKQELIFCSEAPLPTPTLSIWGKKIIRGAPQDGDPNQAQASVTDAGSGTPASERAQVKVAGVHWFSCTPSSIAKMWVRTLIMLILTVGLIVLLLIFGNQLGLLKLK